MAHLDSKGKLAATPDLKFTGSGEEGTSPPPPTILPALHCAPKRCLFSDRLSPALATTGNLMTAKTIPDTHGVWQKVREQNKRQQSL